MNFKSLFVFYFFIKQCCFPQREQINEESKKKEEWNDLTKKDDSAILEKCDNKEEEKFFSLAKTAQSFNALGISQNGIQNENLIESKTLKSNLSKKNSFKIGQNGIKLKDSKMTLDDMSFSEIIGSNRRINDEDIKNSAVLIIEENEGNLLKNEPLVINAKGLLNSKRMANDGITFFGTKQFDNDNKTIINDYTMNIEFPDKLSHIFIIYFKRESKKYYLRAYKEKHIECFPIVLIKLDKQFIIKKKQVFKIDAFFLHVIPSDESLEIHKIDTKKEYSNSKEKFVFKWSQSPITIGRNKDCHISFVGNRAFSRIHCNLSFDIQQKIWMIKDGFETPSTNGVWIYAKHSYELKEATVFRVQNSIFSVKIKDSI